MTEMQKAIEKNMGKTEDLPGMDAKRKNPVDLAEPTIDS